MKFTRLAFAAAILAMLAQCSGGIKKAAVKTDMDTLS